VQFIGPPWHEMPLHHSVDYAAIGVFLNISEPPWHDAPGCQVRLAADPATYQCVVADTNRLDIPGAPAA
jgi:hypothetical protein